MNMQVKRNSIYIAFCVLFFNLSCSYAQNYFILKAKINGIGAGQYLYLLSFSENGISDMDSIQVTQSGLVEFKISEKIPVGLYRLFLGSTQEAQMMHAPPQILDFIFNKQNIHFQLSFMNPFESLKILNPEDKENVLYFEYLKANQVFNQKMDSVYRALALVDKSDLLYQKLIERFNLLQINQKQFEESLITSNSDAFFTHIVKAKQMPLVDAAISDKERVALMKRDFLSPDIFMDTFLLRTNILEEKVISYMQLYFDNTLSPLQQDAVFIEGVDKVLNLAKQGEPSVNKYVLNNLIMGFEMNGRIAVLEHIHINYAEISCENSMLSEASVKRLASISANAIGNPAAEIAANDINGIAFRLSEIKTKHTIVVFFASWCDHCQTFIPELRKEIVAYNNNKHQKDKITVIGVSLDNSAQELQEFIKSNDYSSWIITVDYKSWEGEIARDYNVYSTPTLFLLDEKKTIVNKPLVIDKLLSYLNQNHQHN